MDKQLTVTTKPIQDDNECVLTFVDAETGVRIHPSTVHEDLDDAIGAIDYWVGVHDELSSSPEPYKYLRKEGESGRIYVDFGDPLHLARISHT